MELFLNLAGAAVALSLICLWLRCSVPVEDGATRATQVIALVLLIFILFPVISVTDDLIAAQNPAETDSVHRRNLETHVLQTAAVVAVLPIDVYLPAEPQVKWHPRSRTKPAALPKEPALSPIANRPPPAV